MLSDSTRALAVAALEAYRGAKDHMEYLGVNQDGNQCHQWRFNEAHIAMVDAALADLAAPDATGVAQWAQLPDGEYGDYDTVSVQDDGSIIDVHSAYGNGQRVNAMLPLPADIRLCKLVDAPAPHSAKEVDDEG